MPRKLKTVTLGQLATWVDTGSILTAHLVEDDSGLFQIECRLTSGTDYRVVSSEGGDERAFKTVDAAVSLLRELGVTRILLQLHESIPWDESVSVARRPGRLKGRIGYDEDSLFSEVGVTEDFMTDRNQSKP